MGGSPGALAVDSAPGRNDVLFCSQGKVNFINGDTLTLGPGWLDAPSWETPRFVYDRVHHQAYLLTTRTVWATPNDAWEELRVYTIAARTFVTGAFSVNAPHNTDPQNLADPHYDIEGVAFKQPMSEGNHAGRLIVDNPWGGNVDIVDFDAAGSAPARRQRRSYRAPLSGFSRQDNPGNSLALESRHQTLPSDDLASTDILYIADVNHPQPETLYALWLAQPPAEPAVTRRGTVALNDFRFTPYMVGGLALADARDLLYVATASQSFANGSIGQVSTAPNTLTRMVQVPGEIQEGPVVADWQDPRKVFVCTNDPNDPLQTLTLRLVYGEAPVASLKLVEGYQRWQLRDMVYDPERSRLYITLRDRVLAIGVNYPPTTTTPTPTATVTPTPGTPTATPRPTATCICPYHARPPLVLKGS